jgi:hypothetical protein
MGDIEVWVRLDALQRKRCLGAIIPIFLKVAFGWEVGVGIPFF